MKKFLNISILSAVLLFTAGCSDKFLEIIPPTVKPESEIISSPADLRKVLNAGYEALGYGTAMSGQVWFVNDVMADHINGTAFSGEWGSHYTHTTDIFMGTTRSMMADLGKVIARANFTLDRMSQFDGQMTQAEKDAMRGECLFLRGLAHFELVRLFGQPYGYTGDNSHLGVPIHTKYTIEGVDRSSVGAVYTQVLADLNEAANLLPASNPAPLVPSAVAPYASYATKWAAKGYLAKVYFQMNDFTNAYATANDVIETGGFAFDTEIRNRFSNQGTSEGIFMLTATDSLTDNVGGFLSNNYAHRELTIPAIFLSDYIYNKATADTADLRGKYWYEKKGNFIYCNKFPVNYMQVPLVHLTELMLIRAECIGEGAGDNATKAVADLNKIRSRAGISALGSVSGTALVDAVRAERELEMLAEGNRLQELKRQATRGNKSLYIRTSPWDCNGMVNQIPDNELKGVFGMQPNPQGGCN
jgi:starch-binding outer membrane protein, SusD/RagB family